jgi:D-3-phosphoglycerate dehydrogenase
MKNQVYHCDYSSYLPPSFAQDEEQMINAINHCQFTTSLDKNPNILITSSYTKLETLAVDWNKINLIIHPNSGYDNFSFEFVKNAKFPIILGHQLRAAAVANYILTILLKHFNDIPCNKIWDKQRAFDRTLLCEKKLLLIGFGHIGQLVYRSLEPLLQTITVADPYKKHPALAQINTSDFDIIVVATSLNPTTINLLNYNFFKHAKTDLLLINTARGEIIDETALITFLDANPNAHAYLDVFKTEPFDFTKYNNKKNLKMTSHIAGVYKDLPAHIISFEKDVLTNFTSKSNESFKTQYRDIMLNNRLQKDYLI